MKKETAATVLYSAILIILKIVSGFEVAVLVAIATIIIKLINIEWKI